MARIDSVALARPSPHVITLAIVWGVRRRGVFIPG